MHVVLAVGLEGVFESDGVTENSLLALTLDLTGGITSRGHVANSHEATRGKGQEWFRTGIACGRLYCPLLQ